MIVTTEHSIYQVDLKARVMRRLNSSHDPTPRQGVDGEWKAYDSLTPRTPEVGTSIFIDWGEGRGTLTSLITEIEK